MHLTGAPVDNWMLTTLAEAVRCGTVSNLCVLRIGDKYNTWSHLSPEPFELLDDAGNLLWLEGVGNVLL